MTTAVLTDEQREVVLANVALVEHIVNRVAAGLPSSYSREDLVQTGIIGLITATARYDPARGVAFSTYAGRRIEGAIIDMLRRADWAPRSVRAMERRLATTEDRAGSSTTGELLDRASRELGLDRNQLEQLRHDIAKARVDSLDRPVGVDSGGPTPLSATLVDQSEAVEEAVDGVELVGYLRDGVALLPERHRIVVVGFFFEGMTMTELGVLLGVTQSRASQIKDEALTLLRQALEAVYQDDNAPLSGGTGRPRSPRQLAFNQTLAEAREWRERLATGKGYSAPGHGAERVGEAPSDGALGC